MRERGDLAERVEGARHDVAGLRNHDQRPIGTGECGAQCADIHAARGIGGNLHDAALAEAQVAQCGEHARVRVVAEIHGDGRRAEHPVGLDIPAHAPQQRAARGREAHEVAHRRAARDADGTFARQPQDIGEPLRGNLLGHGASRRTVIAAGVLPPHAREPVGRHAHGMRAAHDPPEEARPGRSHQARFGRRDQTFDDVIGGRSGLGRRAAERAHQRIEIRGCVRLARRACVVERERVAVRGLQRRAGIGLFQ